MAKETMKVLTELLEEKDFKRLKALLEEMNPVDIAAFLEEIPKEKAVVIFRGLSKEDANEVFSSLEVDSQQHIISTITDAEIKEIIEDLSVDDAVDMLEELPANVVKRVMQNTTSETRSLINQFLQYGEDSAGGIMTAEFVDLKKNMTVKEAFAHIRKTGVDKETIYTCYVIDDKRMLEGVVTVKELLLQPYEGVIADIMEENVISVTTEEDKELVVEVFNKYDFLSLPVVDKEGRLVGIVTVDDAVEVMEQEATEDFQIMGALTPSEKPYLKTSIFELAKHRIVWLLVLMVSSMITGVILQKYEAAFAILPLLVTFIPMLTDTGGNAGSQSSTLIIRGMAVSEIASKDFLKVLWKEMGVALLVGLALSAVNFVRLLIMYPGNIMLCVTVVLSLFITVILAKTVGSMLPILAKIIKVDPAIMAAPLITTIVDALSLIIYFNIAVRLLHI